jgi:hypothetical protein
MVMGDHLSLVRDYLRGSDMEDVDLPECVGGAEEWTDNDDWSY